MSFAEAMSLILAGMCLAVAINGLMRGAHVEALLAVIGFAGAVGVYLVVTP